MNFSVNQTRQLYVANSVPDSVDALLNPGDIVPAEKNGYLYFEYQGADTKMRSDLIKVSNIIYANVTPAEKMAYKLKETLIELDTTINEGKIVANQDYMVKINIRQYLGIDDGNTATKYGIVHGYAGLSLEKFYATLALSLAKNFSREVSPLFDFYLKTSSGEVKVKTTDTLDTLNGAYTGVIIREKAQPWTLGTEEQVPVYFDVFVDTIVYNGSEITWGTAEKSDSNVSIENGKKIADMEYFYMGERGDIYRNVGWPNVIKTTYLVNPNIAYDVVDIHYAYVGSNEAVQKSEKTITIVMPTTVTKTFMDKVNPLLGEFTLTLPKGVERT